GPEPFDVVVHACGSGGTAAGVALGVAAHGVAARVVAAAVCDDRAYFEGVIAGLVTEARALRPELPLPAPLEIAEGSRGPAYGVPTAAQLDLIGRVARETGLLFDPVYTGKALHALTHLSPRPRRALLLHTGGLPGLLAHPDLLAPLLGTPAGG
ncbi:MAG: pyridoxal-phosphate dependent enzyme, partial [Deltaproteobacteria bacterium]|nr:pyridoxal-phosphate dependent enzyme [Deltaproteobacteria bacterium]